MPFVKRVWIPKAGQPGKRRPLGIPTIRDRVVQMSAVRVLTAVFEADLPPEQYACRAGRSALDAVKHVHRLLSRGYREVVDADLSGYFDSIPHAELMNSLARRIVDGAMLHLVKRWLEAAVEEEDERARVHRTTRNRFVICCRGQADEALAARVSMMAKLKLTVNPDKTHVRRVPEESFDFLGDTLGRCYKPRTGPSHLGTKPSKKRAVRLCQAISELTDRRGVWRTTAAERVAGVNRMLDGWPNYFCLGSVGRAYRAVMHQTIRRLRQWLRAKHKVRGGRPALWPVAALHADLGLIDRSAKTRGFPWAKA